MNNIKKQILLFFYNKVGQLIYVMDDFKGITWSRDWVGIGDFRITYVEKPNSDLATLYTAAFVSINNDPYKFGVISQISEDYAAGAHTLLITGTELKGLAQKRICYSNSCKTTIKNNTFPEVVNIIMNENMVNPVAESRTFAPFTQTLTNEIEYSSLDDIEYDCKYSTVAEEIKNLAETYEFGWYAKGSLSNGIFTGIEWVITISKDRTLGNTSDNEPLLLSFYDNTVDDMSYDQNINSTGNVGIIAGKGQGAGRDINYYWNGNTWQSEPAGIERNEQYVEAQNSNENEMLAKGKEAIEKNGTFDCSAITPSVKLTNSYLNYEFELGCVGTLRDYNKALTFTKATEIYELGYCVCKFEFGIQNNTISSALKALTANYDNLRKAEQYELDEQHIVYIDRQVRYSTRSNDVNISTSWSQGATVFGEACRYQVATTLANDNTKLPTSKAVYDAMQGVSGGFFIATYGSTSHADILAAYNAGKLCYVRRRGVLILLHSISDSAIFTGAITSNMPNVQETDGVRVICSTANVWSEDYYALANQSALASKISEPANEGTSGQVLTTDGNGGRTWTTVSGSGSVVSVNGKTGAVVLDAEDVGAVEEPATEGTNGQVLTTDGNGGRSWTTVSGSGSQDFYSLTEDVDFTLSTTETKGVAPYSTSYKYTNITITRAGVEWRKGAKYCFYMTTAVNSNYRNLRARIGENGAYVPFVNSAGNAILAGHSFFNTTWYQNNYFYTYETGLTISGASTDGLKLPVDTNTTYNFTYAINLTGAKVDNDGKICQNSFIFATSPANRNNTFSSILQTNTYSATNKQKVEVSKLYVDMIPPLYWTSSAVNAGDTVPSSNINISARDTIDVRYGWNYTTDNMGIKQQAYFYLKNFDPSDFSFEPYDEIGGPITRDRLLNTSENPTIVPAGVSYWYFFGWTGTNYKYNISNNSAALPYCKVYRLYYDTVNNTKTLTRLDLWQEQQREDTGWLDVVNPVGAASQDVKVRRIGDTIMFKGYWTHEDDEGYITRISEPGSFELPDAVSSAISSTAYQKIGLPAYYYNNTSLLCRSTQDIVVAEFSGYYKTITILVDNYNFVINSSNNMFGFRFDGLAIYL